MKKNLAETKEVLDGLFKLAEKISLVGRNIKTVQNSVPGTIKEVIFYQHGVAYLAEMKYPKGSVACCLKRTDFELMN